MVKDWRAAVIAALLASIAGSALTHVQGATPPLLLGNRQEPAEVQASPTLTATQRAVDTSTVTQAERVTTRTASPYSTIPPSLPNGAAGAWRGGRPGPYCWRKTGPFHPARLPPLCSTCHAQPDPEELLVIPGPQRPLVKFNGTVVAVEGPMVVLRAANGTVIHAVMPPAVYNVKPGDVVEASGWLVMRLTNGTGWELVHVEECSVEKTA